MLSQFTFENFKSYKNETTLDFLAESLGEHKEHLIIDKNDGEKALPVIAIYGPNGGGKSTALEGIQCLRAIVLSKLITATDDDIDEKEKRKNGIDLKNKPHKFDENCKDEPIKFDILFRVEDKEFRYQLNVLNNEIVEENLYMRPILSKNAEIVFERNQSDCYLGEMLDGVTAKKIKNSMTLLSHIHMNYDVDVVDKVVNFFTDIGYLDFDKPRINRRIMFTDDKKQQEFLFKMFKEMNINIVDFTLQKDLDGRIVDVFTTHELSNGKRVEIPFSEESGGTRKLFGFLGGIIECLKKGNLVIADEMDAKLHPKLIKYIIELFTNKDSNKYGAQLLLTSHDMYTLSSDVLRRDEIWFCALNEDNASKLYPLISFKKDKGTTPRSDESYNKQYMEGRYGADPYLRKILNWSDDVE